MVDTKLAFAVPESPWVNHAEGKTYCHLPSNSRVLSTAAKAGRLRHSTVGRALMFRREWLDQYLESLADPDNPRWGGNSHAT